MDKSRIKCGKYRSNRNDDTNKNIGKYDLRLEGIRMINIGDMVVYNRPINQEHFESYEKDFINKYLKINKSYKVIKIDRYIDILWYRIIVDDYDLLSYWIPSTCCDSFNIKEKYDLR